MHHHPINESEVPVAPDQPDADRADLCDETRAGDATNTIEVAVTTRQAQLVRHLQHELNVAEVAAKQMIESKAHTLAAVVDAIARGSDAIAPDGDVVFGGIGGLKDAPTIRFLKAPDPIP